MDGSSDEIMEVVIVGTVEGRKDVGVIVGDQVVTLNVVLNVVETVEGDNVGIGDGSNVEVEDGLVVGFADGILEEVSVGSEVGVTEGLVDGLPDGSMVGFVKG